MSATADWQKFRKALQQPQKYALKYRHVWFVPLYSLHFATFVLLYIHMSTDLRKILSICLFTHGCGAVATAHGGKRICLLAIAYPAART